MTISRAIQAEPNKVSVYDENDKELFSKYGKIYKFDDSTVSIVTDETLYFVRTFDKQGNEIKKDFLKFTVEIEFEYKGTTIKGYGIYQKKDYIGAVMISPAKGIRTYDTLHIQLGFPITFNDSRVKELAVESLKKAYDEYLFLLGKKEDVARLLKWPYHNKIHYERYRDDLSSILKFIEQKYENKGISKELYEKFSFRLDIEIYNYNKMIENDFRINFYRNFSIINNIDDVAAMIAHKGFDEDHFIELSEVEFLAKNALYLKL